MKLRVTNRLNYIVAGYAVRLTLWEADGRSSMFTIARDRLFSLSVDGCHGAHAFSITATRNTDDDGKPLPINLWPVRFGS
jgi:hypothetical protein